MVPIQCLNEISRQAVLLVETLARTQHKNIHGDERNLSAICPSLDCPHSPACHETKPKPKTLKPLNPQPPKNPKP